MTIGEALAFIRSKSWLGSKPGLSRTRELLYRLGDPQKRLRFCHIAGTNGKGSAAAMLSGVLSGAGYKTGLYTSPFVTRFNERIRIDGADIGDDALCRLCEKIAPLALSMDDAPTEFELITALALCFFAESGCDIVVLETGMGGRLDSTNVIDAPELAVITSIGLDHTAELGDTAEKIASEKCGIIKPGSSCVLYAQEPDVAAVAYGVCQSLSVPLTVTRPDKITSLADGVAGQKFSYRGRAYRLSLLGAHQLKNAAVVIDAVGILREKGWRIPESVLKSGLSRVKWPARFEILLKNPWFVIDGGHNPQGARSVAEGIKNYFPGKKAILLTGVLADKNYPAIFDALEEVAGGYVCVKPSSPRALDAAALAEYLKKSGKSAAAADSAAQGIAMARSTAGESGLVVCVGSLYLAGEVRELLAATTN